MTTDRLFVIMLVLLIPMTGCFGALDNADAEENTSQTIVNNYYYNNTTTASNSPIIEKFSVGGVIDFNSTTDYTTNQAENYRFYNVYNFTTVPGEFVSIHYFQDSDSYDADLETECDDGSSYSASTSILDQGIGVWGSHANCVHTVILDSLNLNSWSEEYESGEFIMGWNLVYSIESLTVV